MASASVGIVAELDFRAARTLFVAPTGVPLLGWARLAWRGTPGGGPFDAAVARVLDRSVTALGTFFAIALWAEYAPQASVAFSKTGVLVMGAVGLIIGLVAAARHTSCEVKRLFADAARRISLSRRRHHPRGQLAIPGP